MLKTVIAVAVATGLATAAGAADRWALQEGGSKIAYGSIKSGSIGEVNHFSGLSGEVSPEGQVEVEIDLSTVETWVDIRNERMREIVFDGARATLSGQIDLAALEALAPGETTVLEVDGTLGFAGQELPIFTEMFVARLGPDRALVTSDEMIMVSTEELGIDAAIDRLKEIADLPSITRAAPVTVRLVFERTGEGA